MLSKNAWGPANSYEAGPVTFLVGVTRESLEVRGVSVRD